LLDLARKETVSKASALEREFQRRLFAFGGGAGFARSRSGGKPGQKDFSKTLT
jgi:hypothetical protein